MGRCACTTTPGCSRASRLPLARDPGASLEQLARALRVHPHTRRADRARAHRRAASRPGGHAAASPRACTLLRTRPDLSIKEVAAARGLQLDQRVRSLHAADVRPLAVRVPAGSPSTRRRRHRLRLPPSARHRAPAGSERQRFGRPVNNRRGHSARRPVAHSNHPPRLRDRDVPLPGVASARCIDQQEEEMSNAQGKPLAIACATALALAVPPLQAYVRAVPTGRAAGPLEHVHSRRHHPSRAFGMRRGQAVGSDGPPVALSLGADALRRQLEDDDERAVRAAAGRGHARPGSRRRFRPRSPASKTTGMGRGRGSTACRARCCGCLRPATDRRMGATDSVFAADRCADAAVAAGRSPPCRRASR